MIRRRWSDRIKILDQPLFSGHLFGRFRMAERLRVLEAGLSRLTERERLALVLRDVEDLPVEEVAALLNCGKATVRSHIANARVKFRQYLDSRARGKAARPRRPAANEPGELD